MSPRIRITPVSDTSLPPVLLVRLRVNSNTNSHEQRGHLTVRPMRPEFPRSLCPDGHNVEIFDALTGSNIGSSHSFFMPHRLMLVI